MIQLHDIALPNDNGQAGSVDAKETALPSVRDHAYSVKVGISALVMCALLSIVVARVALLRCKSKAFSCTPSLSGSDVYSAIVRSRA